MFAEDLSPFLNLAEFSVPATLPGGQVVPVIFDNNYDGGLGGLMESSLPTIMGATSQLSALDHGSVVSIAGVSWAVAGVQPDGTGMTRLMLERTQ